MKAIALLLVAFVLTNVPAHAASDGKQIVVPRAEYYDIASAITGRTYRVMVATPFKGDPSKEYPVLYVLDGNVHFLTAADRVAGLANNGLIGPGIVVGIGYPTEDLDEQQRLRVLDLTPSVSKDPAYRPGVKSGGGDAFLEAIEKEIKPFVAARYKIDVSRQAFWGTSLGGLAVLRALLRNPTTYATYITSSPSIWWNSREVLSDEDAFSKRVREQDLHLRILITSAGEEQPPSEDASFRMIDNASELADRLARLNPTNVPVTRTIFDGEIHGSVPSSALVRGIRFAFPMTK